MYGGSAALNLISLKDKNEFLASLGLVEVGAPAVWSKHNCFGRNVWLRKDEKETPSKETDAQSLYEGTFGADPFQRLTLKPKCFIHAIIMKTYRLIAVLNITACERTFGMHHFTPRRFDQKRFHSKRNTAELFWVFFPRARALEKGEQVALAGVRPVQKTILPSSSRSRRWLRARGRSRGATLNISTQVSLWRPDR